MMRLYWSLLLTALACAPTFAVDCNVRDYGAKGDRQTNDRQAIQAAIDACSKAGGGTVSLPAGAYLSGALRLRSFITLRLEQGAMLLASKNPDDYTKDTTVFGGLNRAALIFAENAEQVAIIGPGIINGQATGDFGVRWGASEDNSIFRSTLVVFKECRNLTLRDVTLLYSDWWSVHLRGCDTVYVDRVTLLNNPRRLNSDGIDPNSCRNVHISNSHISTGDDAICLKTYDGHPTENVVISNCTLESTTTALKIGTATTGNHRNLHFSNLTLHAPTGIGIYLKDGGTTEHVTFANITIETPPKSYRDVIPILLDVEKRRVTSGLSKLRDVSFRDIYVRSGSSILVQGMAENPIENLSFENLTFRVENPDDYAKRGVPTGGGPARTVDVERASRFSHLPSYFTLAHVNGLILDKVRVLIGQQAWQKYERSAVIAHDVKNVTVRGLYRSPAGVGGSLPVVGLHNAQDVLMTGCRAESGTPIFLGLSGNRTANVSLIGNDLLAARKAYTLSDGAALKVIER